MSINKGIVVLAVAESDSHIVANKLIDQFLRINGYAVNNLGATTSIGEMIEAANSDPETIAIAIGSLNGHAIRDIAPLRTLKSLLVNKSIKIIVGGNIYTDVRNREENEKILIEFGVDIILENHLSLVEYLERLHREKSHQLSSQYALYHRLSLRSSAPYSIGANS